jgi:hypothetical protein
MKKEKDPSGPQQGGLPAAGSSVSVAAAEERQFLLPVADMVPVEAQRQLLEESRARETRLLAEVEARYARLNRTLEESIAEREKRLIDELHARHAAECRRLRREALQAEKNLLAELEARYSQHYQETEVSFAVREKKLTADLEAAAAREAVLVRQLRSARRRLGLVIILAVLGIAFILSVDGAKKSIVEPLLPPADPEEVRPFAAVFAPEPAAPAVLLPSGTPDVKVVTPVRPAEAPAEKRGNGGNFVGGMMR